MNEKLKEIFGVLIFILVMFLSVGTIAIVTAKRDTAEKIRIYEKGYLNGQRDMLLNRQHVILTADTLGVWLPDKPIFEFKDIR